MNFGHSERASSAPECDRVSPEGCVSPHVAAIAPPRAVEVVAGNDTRGQRVSGNVVPGVVLGVSAKRRRITADSMLESEGDVADDELNT